MTYRVTASYPRGDLSAREREGSLIFTPSTTIVGDGHIVLPAPVTAHLVDGRISVPLIGTDDPAYSPSGWVWTVTEQIEGGRPPWSFELTSDADLSELTAVVPPGEYALLVPASRSVVAGEGLDGGGMLAADVTLTVDLSELDGADLGSGAALDGRVLTADGSGGSAWEAVTGGGSGAVASVNGATGVVVLGASDVGADPAGTAASAVSTHLSAAPHVGLGSGTPAPLGAASAGTGTTSSRTDHVHAMPTAANVGAAATSHTHVPADVTGTAVVTSDPRLSDARTPTAHSHPASAVSDSTAVGRSVLTAVDASAARTAIGAGTSSFDGAYATLSGKPTLGTAAPLNVSDGTTAAAGEVVKGNDTRLIDARTPTAHKASHATGGADVLTPADIGAATSGHTHSPATPAAHAASHGVGQSDAVTIAPAQVTGTAVITSDPRLSDARTPTAHTHGVADMTATGTKSDTTFLRGDNTWATPPDGGGGGVTDHGALTGLADDDHSQYAKADGTRGAFAAPLGADDNYVTDAEKSALHGHANKVALDAVSGTNTGDQTLPTWTTLAGKPAVVAAGADAATARTAIGAGTSSLVIGTTVSTAKAGNYAPAAASATAQGIVELATPEEAATGTDNVRAVTPQGLKGVADTKAATSHTHVPEDVTGTAVVTSDARLSDSRTPTAHKSTHATGGSDILTPSDIGAATAAQGALAASASQPGHGHTLDAVTDTATRLAMTPAERTKVGNTSGTNTGDQTLPTWSTLSGKPAVVAAGVDAVAARTAVSAIAATDVLAGTNVTVTHSGGQVTINSAGSGGIAGEAGILEFDDPAYAGATDDDTLDNLMSAAAGVSGKKPTIRLPYRLVNLNRSHTPYTGFALIGAGGPVPVEQKRGGDPYASPVKVNLPGTAGSSFLFDLPAGNTHRMTIQGISWEGDGDNTSWLGSNNGGVLWTSTLRDLAFSAFYSVLGSRQHKLLNTAILTDGYWNINNSKDTAVVVGGSDSIFWVGSQFLIDSPTSLNEAIISHMWFDHQEKTVVGGAFCTCEGKPTALRITGSNTGGTGLVFWGMRFEGRNSGAPSYGSVIRVEGGKVTFRDCWTAYGYTNPGSANLSGALGVITATGGEITLEGCTYSRASGIGVDVPWIGASGADTKVIVRTTHTADDGGAWSGEVPKVSLSGGATLDHDYSVRGPDNLTGERWMAWTGTQAAYDALGSYDSRRLYVIV